MPAPAELKLENGRLAVDASFQVAFQGVDDARVHAAVARLLRRWEERSGLTFARTSEAGYRFASAPDKAALVIACDRGSAAIPELGEDERYTLAIGERQAVLHAVTTTGALRGLATLSQLLQVEATGWSLPAVQIRDQPRFQWRGLMVDVCRHWQPLDVIERTLDGMELVKLNVLHLHLSEDQGFRVESKTHPELQNKGSDGHYFTQEELRQIVTFAAARGIRVVPEFDVPGHATSWCVAHPELASAPGPYVVERKWGVFDPVLDPTNEGTYALLADVLGEMAAVFPDPYFHIGGDENNGKQWNANAHIQAFIREHALHDNAGLHAYFNGRVRTILTQHGKRVVGWDEVLHPDLPKDGVVQSWRGPEGLAAAVKAGHPTLLSNGYYIDLCYSAAQHYLNDPLPANNRFSAAEQALVLGGEATMWAEWVSPETIDSRIWPRTAAIAERLWSPREVNDVADMYRRLAIVSRRLEEAGLLHERNRPAMLRRLAGDGASPAELAALGTLVDLVEPVKEYGRNAQQPDATQATPLTGIADCARPESDAARAFAVGVQEFLATADHARGSAAALLETLAAGADAAQTLRPLCERSARLHPAVPLLASLGDACRVGIQSIQLLHDRAAPAAGWREAQLAVLERGAQPREAVELPLIAPLRALVDAAAAPPSAAGPATK